MKKQGFLYGSVILVASVVITKVIGALFKIPLANLLGGAGMGYFSCAYGLFMPIYAISVTGLPTAVAKLTAENAVFERYANLRKLRRISLLTFAIMGLFSSIVVVLLAMPFARYVVETPDAFPAIAVIAPSILFGCIMAVYRGYYEGLRNMYPTALSQVTEAVVKLAAGLFFCCYILEMGTQRPDEFLRIVGNFQSTAGLTVAELLLPYASAAAVLGVTLSSFAGMVFLILRHLIVGDGITKAELQRDTVVDSAQTLIASLMRIVIPVAIGSLVTNLTSLIDLGTIVRSLNTAIERTPTLFAEINLPREDISNFLYGSFTGLAVTIFNLVPSFTNMFAKGILPNLSEAWALRDKARIEKSIVSVLFVTSLVAVPAGLGICLFSKEILAFLYASRGAEILVSFEALRFLGIGVIFLSLTAPVFAMLQAVGRADLPVKIMLIGVAVKLIGNLLLIPLPNINIMGAGISTLLCYIIICVAAIFSLCKTTKVEISAAKTFMKPTYSALLCCAAAKITYDPLVGLLGNRVSLLLAIGFGGVIYLISLYLLGGIAKSKRNTVV